ncbi:hypothetical protein [Embleya sp. NPDC059259]|uniref:hypothetical protein n=1 Tax=unclassified Embleya TaxID=2699296 RepID=UPI0036A7C316
MAVFACAGCGAVLTAPVSRVALPGHARQSYGHVLLPALLESGTYAVDPAPSGPPWRPWAEVEADEAAAQGVFAPVFAVSFGAPGAIAIAPGDTRGTALIPERCDGYCMGLDGRAGPNLACLRCGRPVATRIDDCTYWQAVWLDRDAVRRLPVDGPADRPIDWATLAAERAGTPPVDPRGWWSPQWEAAVAVALAHLSVASAGRPVEFPDGLVADTFARAWDMLLPPGPPGLAARKVALAGPRLPDPGPAADIVLVPIHPQTGQAWQQPSGTAAVVPLSAEVWLHLAFPRDRLLVPATGGLPIGVLRDDLLPPHPPTPFGPDADIFLATLARLPAVREPWLRALYDRGRHRVPRLFR